MEKLPFLVFKEHSSLDFGLLVVEKGSFKGAERDITNANGLDFVLLD